MKNAASAVLYGQLIAACNFAEVAERAGIRQRRFNVLDVLRNELFEPQIIQLDRDMALSDAWERIANPEILPGTTGQFLLYLKNIPQAGMDSPIAHPNSAGNNTNGWDACLYAHKSGDGRRLSMALLGGGIGCPGSRKGWGIFCIKKPV